MKLSSLISFAATAFVLVACNTEESPLTEGQGNMKIEVHDGMMTNILASSKEKSRAYQSKTDDNDKIGLVTTFTDGDVIGLWEVKDGKLAQSNVKYTIQNGKWTADGAADPISYDQGATYFAMYPYKTNAELKTLTGASEDKAENYVNLDKASATAAEFFKPIIDKWTPAANQNSETAYTASDLMVSKGTASSAGDNKPTTMSFTMDHQMALALLSFNAKHYVLNGGDYSWDIAFDKAYVGNYHPFADPFGNERLLVRPNETVQVPVKTDNKTENIAVKVSKPGCYRHFEFSGGNETFTLQIGDYFYTDGTLSHSNSYPKKTVAGRVVYVPNSNAPTDMLPKGYGHALIIGQPNADQSKQTFQCDLSKDSDEIRNQFKNYTRVCDVITDCNGYENTQKLTAIDATLKSQLENYVVLTNDKEKAKNTGWFIPSAGQVYWTDNCRQMVFDLRSNTNQTWSLRTQESLSFPVQYLLYVYIGNANFLVSDISKVEFYRFEYYVNKIYRDIYVSFHLGLTNIKDKLTVLPFLAI